MPPCNNVNNVYVHKIEFLLHQQHKKPLHFIGYNIMQEYYLTFFFCAGKMSNNPVYNEKRIESTFLHLYILVYYFPVSGKWNNNKKKYYK